MTQEEFESRLASLDDQLKIIAEQKNKLQNDWNEQRFKPKFKVGSIVSDGYKIYSVEEIKFERNDYLGCIDTIYLLSQITSGIKYTANERLLRYHLADSITEFNKFRVNQ